MSIVIIELIDNLTTRLGEKIIKKHRIAVGLQENIYKLLYRDYLAQ